MLAAGVRSRIGARVARFAARATVPPEERRLAGSVSGAFFIIGGVTVAPLTLLPGIPHAHNAVLLAIGAAALLWGLCSLLLIDWTRAPPFLIHLSVVAGLGVIAATVASSGGATSPT